MRQIDMIIDSKKGELRVIGEKDNLYYYKMGYVMCSYAAGVLNGF